MIGLKRGIMQFDGIGPDKTWELTHVSGAKYNLWEIFCHVLPHMNYVRLYAGYGHVFLKQRNNHTDAGVYLDHCVIHEFIKAGIAHDPYLQKIVAWFSALSTHVNGTLAQSQSNYAGFALKSADYKFHASTAHEPNSVGLYLDIHGFCRLEYVRMRKVCHIGRPDQCIFLVHMLIDRQNYGQNNYFCGKFCKTYAQKIIGEYAKNPHDQRMHGTCTCLRGIEI